MQFLLLQQLSAQMLTTHSDKLIQLQDDGRLEDFQAGVVAQLLPIATQLLAEGSPLYTVEEICTKQIGELLGFSTYECVRTILDEEFTYTYHLYQQAGILTYEVINMITFCQPLLTLYQAADDNRMLHYELMGSIREYLDQNE